MRILPPTLLAATLAACSGATEPEWRRDIGTLFPAEFGAIAVEAPTSARAGESFEVTVTTAGSSACVRASGATVTVAALTATVVPMDERYVGPRMCTDDLAPHPRRVSLRFSAAGTATLRVSGRSSTDPTQLTVIERQVEIEP
ncbi:MAG TPA: hypothetical protein VFR15_16110 [Chloroflexia bacterium]|nr:hypothetical protein [Chloroflexia bacterium]